MDLESRYPLQNNPLLYDKYLEQGFFKGSSIKYKIKLLCIGNRLSSVINIRLPLYNFEIKKWQKKLITKNTQHFKFTITPFRYSEQLEILYQNQKRKFKGFL